MKKILCLFIVCQLSCVEHKIIKKNALYGDWYPVYNKNFDSIPTYLEININENEISYLANDNLEIEYFIDYNLLLKNKFSVKDNVLYVENMETEKLEKKGKISVTKNQLTINYNGKNIVYSRIQSTKTLHNVFENKLSKEEFISSYKERSQQWNNGLTSSKK